MAGNPGTMTTINTLRNVNTGNVIDYGEDRILEAVRLELDIINAQVTQALGQLVESTGDNMRRMYGPDTKMEMEEIDETGTPDTQMRAPSGLNIGFPLRRFSMALQWTRIAFRRMVPAELAAQVDDVTRADRSRLFRELRRAIFKPTDYTFVDVFGPKEIELPVKAYANADSFTIPLGPNGEYFDPATHTHYLATASLVAGDVSALLSTVNEHYDGGSQYLYINKAQENAIRSMTANFTAYPTAAAAAQDTTNNLPVLIPNNPNNRAIGVFDGVEVWVKTWIPASYLYTFMIGGRARKPLVLRRPDDGPADLTMVYEDESHALRARNFERLFGFAVYERTNGAVLYIGGGTYVAPVIS